MSKYVVFHIDGGLGKHVAATAVAQCIKHNHPDRKLIVVAAWPEIFINLDFVDRVYRSNAVSYFYEDFVKDQDTLIFRHDPYFDETHIKRSMHLIETWCQMFDLDYDDEQPVLKFNYSQKVTAHQLWKAEKPTLLLHTHGGFLADNAPPYSWNRDMPLSLAQQVADAFKQTHTVVQVSRPNAPKIQGAIPIAPQPNTMDFLSILLLSDKRLLIDSSLQHAAAALGLPSVVLWVGTDPAVFGYNTHTNIQANLGKVKLPDSYLYEYSLEGRAYECPFEDESTLFNSEQVIKYLSG